MSKPTNPTPAVTPSAVALKQIQHDVHAMRAMADDNSEFFAKVGDHMRTTAKAAHATNQAALGLTTATTAMSETLRLHTEAAQEVLALARNLSEVVKGLSDRLDRIELLGVPVLKPAAPAAAPSEDLSKIPLAQGNEYAGPYPRSSQRLPLSESLTVNELVKVWAEKEGLSEADLAEAIGMTNAAGVRGRLSGELRWRAHDVLELVEYGCGFPPSLVRKCEAFERARVAAGGQEVAA